MQITAELVKKLRDETGAGVMDSKRALQETDGDFARARDILHKQGLDRAEKRTSRVAAQGVIEAYIHGGGRVATLVELNCETDFVARTPEFRALAHDLAMQVAAMNPKCVRESEWTEGSETPKSEAVLLCQPFIKDPGTTIETLVKTYMSKTGENIVVRRFVRFELGEESR